MTTVESGSQMSTHWQAEQYGYPGYDSHNYDPCTFDPHPEAYCIKSTLDIKHIAPLTKCFKIITYFCVQGTLIMKVALDKGLIDALT